MRLTAFTDYGLRALMRIASDPSRGFSTAELADEFGLSRHHLAKIVQRLAQGGILSTRRGGGAFAGREWLGAGRLPDAGRVGLHRRRALRPEIAPAPGRGRLHGRA